MREEFDKDGLVALIRSGDLKSAKVAIMSVFEYHAAEYACFGVFESAVNPPTELIEVALKKYMGTHEACTWKPYHGYWVHSLSHFTGHLWQLRLTDWIKKFNEVAFNGAVEYSDENCSDRLVGDFAEHSLWSDNPADFYLTPISVRWMRDWEYQKYAKARIEVGCFKSEADFLRWRLNLPTESKPRTDDFGASDAVRLKELGEDVSKFASVLLSQLKKRLAKDETFLAGLMPDNNWQRERCEKLIAGAREAIAKLS